MQPLNNEEEVVGPAIDCIFTDLRVLRQLEQDLGVAPLELLQLSGDFYFPGLKRSQLPLHRLAAALYRETRRCLVPSLRFSFDDIFLRLLYLLIELLDAILSRLETLRGQGPEVAANSNFVGLHQVIIDERLTGFLDCLQRDALLRAELFDFFQIQHLLLLVEHLQEFGALLIER